MKRSTLKRRIRSTALALAGVGMLGATNTSRAAVTIYFEQVGSDVRVSADGTLDIQPTAASAPFSFSGSSVLSDQILHQSSGNMWLASVGFHSDTPVSFYAGTNAGAAGAFGFSFEALAIDASDISGGTTAAVTQITWSPAEDFFIVPNRTLASLNADNLQNTPAWTAFGSEDFISLQTGAAPAPIPEPSAALLALGGFAVLLGRRRPRNR